MHQGDARSIPLKNGYASATPVTDGERLYVWFGEAGLFFLDLNGTLLWKVLGVAGYKTRGDWGSGASPVLHGNPLLLVNDNRETR